MPVLTRSSLLAIVAVAAFATPARALTCDVNTPTYPSIQSAVDDANCTQIHIPAGGYSESVVISRSVEIYGDDKNTTAVVGNHASVFHLNPSGNFVQIHDLTITGGKAVSGGGIYDNGNALTINNCIIDSNQAVVARQIAAFSLGAGGGVFLTGAATATIDNTTFSNNSATLGGGLAVDGVSRPLTAGALVQNCIFSQNSATVSGGGIFSILGGLFIGGTTIEDNHVNCVVLATGGGISTLLSGTLIQNSHFLRNNATSSTIDAAGGAINNAGDFLDNTIGFVTISDTDFVSNSTTAYFLGSGGAISNTTGGTVDCTRCLIRNNSSGNGGGIDSDRHSVVNLTDTTISGNTVSGIISAFGGGIRLQDSTLTMLRTTIDHNHATGLGRGGAIYVAADSGIEAGSSFTTAFPTSVTITNSTIANNNADALGGALGGRGGGIYAETTGTLSNLQINLRNVTMAFDSADLLGNEIYHDADATVFQSKIIAENTIMKSYVGTSPIDCTTIVLGNGGTTSNGGNVGDCFITGGSDINGDPLLSTITNAGGLTETIPITGGSPAINHGTGNCPGSDQRGTPRDGQCDTGAFEYIDAFLNARIPPGAAAPSNTPIGGTFSRNMTATPNTFMVISELQGTMNATVTGSGTTNVGLTPAAPLIVGDTVHVIASRGIFRSDTGIALQNPQQWSFSVNNTTPFCSGGFKQVNTNIPLGFQSFMTWADYDGDGKLDILACGLFAACDIYRNNAGTFTPIHAALPYLSPVTAAWGDYDGDGKPDFILSGIDFNTGLPVTKLFHNNGGGSFTEATTTLPQVANGTVAWADYNNDGRLDLLLAGTDKDNKASVDIYKNLGGGNFQAINSGLPQLSYMKAAWGDFNGDGYPDVIVQGHQILVRTTQVYQNVGNDAFVAVGADVALADGSVTWIDYDNDGKLDALVTGLAAGGAAQTVLLHNASTIFQVQSPPLPPLFSSSVIAVDFDGDGLLDLVLTGETGNTQFSGVFRNMGGGNFTQIADGLPPLQQSFIQAGDYDRDGHVDLLAYGWNGTRFIAAVEQQIPCSAADDAFVVTQDQTLTVAAPGVMANDHEVNPTVTINASPAHGAVLLTGGGGFTYTPAGGFFGNDSFTYHLADGTFSTNVATVSLHVNPTGSCRATFDSGATIYASSDNSALQQAIDLAPAGSTIKISGTCAGTAFRNGFNTLAYIDKSLTLIGGFAGSNWTTSDPVANVTTLDAVGRGNVIVIPAAGPVVAIDNLVMQNGAAVNPQIDGGDIYNNGGTLSIDQCTITNGGSFFGNGGGLFNTGTATITRSTIDNCLAVNGSGIWTSGPLTLRNTTISLNGGAAHGSGGGLYVNGGATTINNATFHNNNAGTGNTITVSGGTVTISNSILSTAGTNCSGAIVSNGYNLATDGSCSLTAIGDLPNTAPNLGTLIASNGGPTQTFLLNTGSPALDAGYPGTGAGTLCESTDQRDVGRPQGNRCDIGAFESTTPTTPALCYALVVHNGAYVAVYGNGTSSGQAIRDAIAAAVAGDTIKIAGKCEGGGGGNVGGFVSLATDNMFVVNKTLTFIGGYNWYFQEPSDPIANPTVLDAQTVARIAGVRDTGCCKTVTFQNLQFINGQTAGGEPGGAIFADRRNNIVISGCTFNNNKAYGAGAVSLAEGLNATTLSIDHSTFTGNAATSSSGGALSCGSNLSGANTTISDSLFKSNTAAQNGGAIAYTPQIAGQQLTLTRVTFDSNSLPSFFSGAAVQAIGTGGLTITDSTFKNNTGATGALKIALNGTADITGTTFDGNSGAFLGTAIDASGVSSNPLTLNVTDSTFVNNVGTTSSATAGISISSLATLNLTRSTFSGNTSGGQGGALNVGLSSTAATIVDSTFSGNTASFGGAIMASAGTTLIKSSTFSGNQSTGGGSGGTLGAIGTGVTVTLQNDILANTIVQGTPFNPTCSNASTAALFVSSGNNLSTDADTGCHFIGTDLTNANAGLDVLADNGGKTKTMALLPSSGALDTGSCSGLTVDQRGLPRPAGTACDIGSFERQSYSTSITAIQSSTSSVVGEPVTFIATVTASGPGTPTGTVTFGAVVVPLAANGTATATMPFNSIVPSIFITYSGDANFNSSSVTLPHTVNKATSFINLGGVTPSSAASGTALTTNFSIGVLAPGVAAPAGGTITVSDGVESCTATAPATSCILTLHSLGARTITASYSGDANLTASASAPLPHTVTLPIVPILSNILPYQDTANHRITPGQIVNVPLSQISLVFNEAMNAPLSASDPTSVQNPANYLLVGDGGDGVISTTVCTAPSGADVVVRVDPIFYGSNTATLNLNGGTQVLDGKYRLLICPTIQDTLGNELGPYTIDFSVDTTVPGVTLVNSVANTGDNVLAENEGTTVAITQLLLTFSEAINTTDATSTTSYKLVAAGPNRTIDSTACATGVLGDDVAIPTDTAAYNAATHIVTLGINGGTLLPDSLYRLFVCGSSVHNLATTPMAADFVRNFSVDHNPPTDPTSLASTTHAIGAWSRLNQITMQWSGATDSVAVAGYSVVFDSIAATVPDTTIDVPHTTDPHSTTSAVLPDGQPHYFHLRTCDFAGHCTSGLNRGPYMIDTTAPSIPTNVQSTSHQVNVASINPHIAMTWSASTDVLSGVAGYSFAFNQTAAATCDQIMKQTGTTVTSGPLSAGTWYFHVCTTDVAGNWSTDALAGPFIINGATAPRVTNVSLTENEATRGPVTQLVVTFDQDVNVPVVSNFLLISPGPNGVYDTTSCGAGLTGDDVKTTISTASYSSALHQATLNVSTLPDARDRLLVCASIQNIAALPLDGNGDGIGGDDFPRNFLVDATAPTIPANIVNTNAVGQLAMTWSSSTDALSGLAGYSYAFDQNATWACDQAQKLGAAVTSAASAPLIPGGWYFHICAADNLQNWSAAANAGPFTVTAPPATVLKVNSVADTGDGVLAENEATNVAITQILVTFDHDPPGPSNVANYAVIAAGADQAFETISCAGGIASTDVARPITSLTYDTVGHVATLNVASLPDSHYRLIVCAALTGADFVRNFTVDTTPPALPVTIDSDHTVGSVSSNPIVAVTWTPSTDLLSSVAGYDVVFDQNPTTPCGRTQNAPGTATSATSPSLTSGNWYFHLCTVDTVGNWSGSTARGPFIIAAAGAIPTLSPALLLLLAAAMALIAIRATR